uniref:Uncharacterized protein n=1 Tax=Anguilla anguilla TaxID=7936 RepID=A0A0E9WE51_ANGAN
MNVITQCAFKNHRLYKHATERKMMRMDTSQIIHSCASQQWVIASSSNTYQVMLWCLTSK